MGISNIIKPTNLHIYNKVVTTANTNITTDKRIIDTNVIHYINVINYIKIISRLFKENCMVITFKVVLNTVNVIIISYSKHLQYPNKMCKDTTHGTAFL